MTLCLCTASAHSHLGTGGALRAQAHHFHHLHTWSAPCHLCPLHRPLLQRHLGLRLLLDLIRRTTLSVCSTTKSAQCSGDRALDARRKARLAVKLPAPRGAAGENRQFRLHMTREARSNHYLRTQRSQNMIVRSIASSSYTAFVSRRSFL